MIDQGKNILIGVFVIAAISLLVWMLMFLHPSVGDDGKVLRVRFSDVDKISLGTRVTYAGKPVGEVVDIILLENARSGPPDQLGRVYMYELVCLVDSSVHVYNTDDVSVYTSGLLGERSVAINPRKPQPGDVVKLLDNQVIYGKGTAGMEDAFEMIRTLADKAEHMLDSMTTFVETNNEDLNRTIKSARRTIDNLDLVVSRANETDMVGSIDEAAERFATTMNSFSEQLAELDKRELWDKLDATMTNVEGITTALNHPDKLQATLDNVHQLSGNLSRLSERLEGSWERVDDSLDDLQVTMANAREITEDGRVLAKDARDVVSHIAAGKGSVGKIIKSDDFYLKVNALMTKAETLMNDVNHYGFLFHLDKSWQRSRTRRANELADLESPDEFRSYFDREVDSIQTSLTRVSLLLKDADYQGKRDKMLENREFVDVFSDLLRRVDNLESTLKYYNEMLRDNTQ